jgi:hypothetical protein
MASARPSEGWAFCCYLGQRTRISEIRVKMQFIADY